MTKFNEKLLKGLEQTLKSFDCKHSFFTIRGIRKCRKCNITVSTVKIKKSL